MKLSRKNTIISLVTLAIIGAGTFAYLETAGIVNFFGLPKETEQEAKENLEKKGDLITDDQSDVDNKTDSGKPETDADDTYTPPASADNIALDISQPSATEVVVSTKLEGYSDGTCKLTVSNAGKKTTQTAAVMFQREYSTCAGFTVPISSVGAGSWDILLEVTSGGITTSKATKMEVR